MREGGEVLAISPGNLKEIITEEPSLSDTILKAFLARRWVLMRVGTGLWIVGSRHSQDALRLREFAFRNRLPHAFIELEEDEEVEALLERFSVRPQEMPVAIWLGEKVLKNPTNAELARAIGLDVDTSWRGVYDLIVVGAGPAGLAAAVYGGLRRPLHPRSGGGGLGRPGRDLISDRELPGLSRGALWFGAHQPRLGAGRQGRRPHYGAPRGGRLEEGERPLGSSPLGGL
jgi:hypothetical protein